ncbi:hypothetical protein LJB83_01595 [Clostridia bacterium OttesenSCG-928-F22]|nr:hypothetical protein [Clostridia bacterium OttesenSCG-928-F22]
MLGTNMFAYCLNNPVMFSDSTGSIPGLAFIPWLIKYIPMIWEFIQGLIIGAGIVGSVIIAGDVLRRPQDYSPQDAIDKVIDGVIADSKVEPIVGGPDTKTKANTKTKTKNPPKVTNYWYAEIANGQVIPTNPATFEQVVSSILSGSTQNFIAKTYWDAFNVVMKTGWSEYEMDEEHRGLPDYYWHFHFDQTGHGDPHLWHYGGAELLHYMF